MPTLQFGARLRQATATSCRGPGDGPLVSRRGRLLATGAVALVSIAAAEGLVRLLLDPPGLYPKPEETPVMMTHPKWGFALRPGATGQYTAGGHSGRIRINRRGFRDGSFDAAVHSTVRLLAVGDSFTLGLGVDSTDPWPEQLETIAPTGIRVQRRCRQRRRPGL